MKLASIKAGRWYETRVGIGECLRAGGSFPPAVQMRIVAPFPRGVVYVTPRDVQREVQKPEGVS